MKLHKKYIVRRPTDTDLESTVTNYFVLKYDTDPFAIIAMKAYARAVRKAGFDEFADDIEKLLLPFDKEFKKPNCPLCGSTQFTRFTQEYTDAYGKPQEAELHCVCSDCGNMFKSLHNT